MVVSLEFASSFGDHKVMKRFSTPVLRTATVEVNQPIKEPTCPAWAPLRPGKRDLF